MKKQEKCKRCGNYKDKGTMACLGCFIKDQLKRKEEGGKR